MNVIIDTREQHPLIFKSPTVEHIIKKKLEVGDYSIEGFEDKIAIERKSVPDLFQTLGKGHKRFKRELERSKNYEFFAIVVEGAFSRVYNKNFEGAEYTRLSGVTVAQICTTLLVKYSIPIIYCNSREESSMFILSIFKSYYKLKEEDKL